jgi:predicted nucleic acid-binding protein
MKRVIIDTDILIDIGRNVAKAVLFLELLHKYHLSYGLLIADAIIAATAIIKGASLATKNRNDYRFIDELDMVSYEQ